MSNLPEKDGRRQRGKQGEQDEGKPTAIVQKEFAEGAASSLPAVARVALERLQEQERHPRDAKEEREPHAGGGHEHSGCDKKPLRPANVAPPVVRRPTPRAVRRGSVPARPRAAAGCRGRLPSSLAVPPEVDPEDSLIGVSVAPGREFNAASAATAATPGGVRRRARRA